MCLNNEVLSAGGIKQGQTYIPPLLAVGAVHQHLLKANCRLQASIVAETAQAWSTHHVACLVGFGASAVLPYAAYDGVRAWHASTKTKSLMDNGKIPAISVDVALDNPPKCRPPVSEPWPLGTSNK